MNRIKKYFKSLRSSMLIGTYTPLVKGLPDFNANGDLSDYINSLYKIALALGATLGVLLIAVAGFRYMTTDAMSGKKDSLKQIRNAIIGLLMLLSTYFVFSQINPDILNLQVGNVTP